MRALGAHNSLIGDYHCAGCSRQSYQRTRCAWSTSRLPREPAWALWASAWSNPTHPLWRSLQTTLRALSAPTWDSNQRSRWLVHR